MTREEKARAYDEALKRADSLTEKYGGREFAEYVFPELAESEDAEQAAARYERENRQSILSSVDIVNAFIEGAK